MADETEKPSVEFTPQDSGDGKAPSGAATANANDGCRCLKGRGRIIALVVLLAALALVLVGGILGSLERPNPWHTFFTGAGTLLALIAFTAIFFAYVLTPLREAAGRFTTPEYGAVFGLILSLLFVYVVAGKIVLAVGEMFSSRLGALEPLLATLFVVPAEIARDGLERVPWEWVLGALFIALVVGTVVKSFLPKRGD